jgi:phosphatidylserine/phosphatidylglycerophosphate/cardiolipin synthase-like enzyme
MAFAQKTHALAAHHVERVATADLAALVSYLNLPHLGALDDADAPPRLGENGTYEVCGRERAVLLDRRTRCGGRFSSPAGLVGIDGFGQADLSSILERSSNLRRYGHRVRPVWGGPDAERELFALIDSAQHHIHIVTLIVGGNVGVRLARVLAAKMRDGVAVRLMFSTSGFVVSGSPSATGLVSPLSEQRSWLWHDRYERKRIVRELRAHRVPFIDASPIARHWRRSTFKSQGVGNRDRYAQWARAREIPDPWIDDQLRIDATCASAWGHLDHRKMVIVDGQKAFLGSQNIADSYLYGNELDPDPRVNRGRWQWHDCSAVIEGGCVADLNHHFARRWCVSGGDLFDPADRCYSPTPERVGDAVVTIQSSLPVDLSQPFWPNAPRLCASMLGANVLPVTNGKSRLRDRMIGLPSVAETSFLAEHCYPTDGELLRQWAAHANRIRHFRMVVPLHYDTVLTGLECDRFYPELKAAKIDLQGFERAILHSKIAVADRHYVALGSYNLCRRSARSDLELEVFVQDRDFGAAVADRINADVRLCRPIEPPLFHRIRSRCSIPVFDALMRYFVL